MANTTNTQAKANLGHAYKRIQDQISKLAAAGRAQGFEVQVCNNDKFEGHREFSNMLNMLMFIEKVVKSNQGGFNITFVRYSQIIDLGAYKIPSASAESTSVGYGAWGTNEFAQDNWTQIM